MEIVEIWGLSIVTLFIGYYTGQGKLTRESIGKTYKRIIHRGKVGAISNASQKIMEKNPVVEGELEEMRKAFGKIKFDEK